VGLKEGKHDLQRVLTNFRDAGDLITKEVCSSLNDEVTYILHILITKEVRNDE